MHQKMAATVEACVQEIRAIQKKARSTGKPERPRWPMIILRSPKGWTGPKEVDGHKVENFWRAHQVPVLDVQSNPEHLQIVEQWMRSYKPEELFDEHGTLIPELRDLPPTGERRMSANPHANGGKLRKPLDLPNFCDYAVPVEAPGAKEVSPTETLGKFLRDVMRRNMSSFRVFSPDENASNRLQDVYEASLKTWLAAIKPEDADGTDIAPDGRVMEMLSEHTLEGWLEGYLLTGRHGLFNTYEAFAHIIDSMYNQHAKWLEKSKREIDWRAPISSLESPDHVARLAPGSQRLHSRRSRLSGSCQQQERGNHPHLPSPRCELPAQRGGPLPAQRELCERDRRRQAAAPGLSRYGCRDHSLHQRHRHLGLGQQ